jgi:hypothetical protein
MATPSSGMNFSFTFISFSNVKDARQSKEETKRTSFFDNCFSGLTGSDRMKMVTIIWSGRINYFNQQVVLFRFVLDFRKKQMKT